MLPRFQGWVIENPKATIASAAAVTSGLLYYWSLGLIGGELSRGLRNAKKAFFMGISSLLCLCAYLIGKVLILRGKNGKTILDAYPQPYLERLNEVQAV